MEILQYLSQAFGAWCYGFAGAVVIDTGIRLWYRKIYLTRHERINRTFYNDRDLGFIAMLENAKAIDVQYRRNTKLELAQREAQGVTDNLINLLEEALHFDYYSLPRHRIETMHRHDIRADIRNKVITIARELDTKYARIYELKNRLKR